MKEEDFKEILERPEINATGIANKMYEGKSNPRSRLYNKVNRVKSGHSTQQLTDEDLKKAWGVLKDLADAINDKAPKD
ncbi:hypothetical protein [Pedobacter glucosidilyticus]|uniref:hypothetical protein n=1 Tax=Pedobacter glucosidilyticus TaxID=1122941 RepID=UPI0004151D9B|nr:hypothetical protein [Pedobacter glucosidilyticus]